jgi:SAM-dependent methyltransferase
MAMPQECSLLTRSFLRGRATFEMAEVVVTVCYMRDCCEHSSQMQGIVKAMPDLHSNSRDGKYYQAMKPNSLAEQLGIRARDRIYEDFLRFCRPQAEATILDIGVSDVIGKAANVLERRYPYPDRVTAAGIGTAEEFRETFPRVTYRQIVPNKPLPFPDKSFDIATSNAVLEHVGSLENQRRFIADTLRVARRVFITVPCRFFPVEHHTSIPFLHWFDSGFALGCRLLGKQDWCRQENLILMSRKRLQAACPSDARGQVGITGILLGPCSANLYLYVEQT